MASLHGSISEFDPEKEEWISYVERMGHYLMTNDVDSDAKKRAVLLSTCGAKTYQLIRSLVAPRKPVSQEIWHPRKFGTPMQFFLGKLAPLQENWNPIPCQKS